MLESRYEHNASSLYTTSKKLSLMHIVPGTLVTMTGGVRQDMELVNLHNRVVLAFSEFYGAAGLDYNLPCGSA